MRWIGLALVVGAGFLAGCAAGDSLRRRADFLGQVGSLLTFLGQEAEYSGDTFGAILSRSNACALFQMEKELLYSDLPLQLLRAMNNGPCRQNLTPEQRDTLKTLWNALGTGPREREIKRLSLAARRFSAWENEARTAAESKGALYRTVGLYGGLAAAVLLA